MNPVALGSFDLIEPMFGGGAAEVWQGVHRDQHIPVAIKVMFASQASSEQFQLMFHDEVRAVAGLDHPNIITVFDYGEVPQEAVRQSGLRLRAGSPYLVMEWADQGTLGRIEPPESWLELKSILTALLDALGHAHARGVIHLDLKPDNILRCTTAQGITLKLSDFGIAYALERHELPSPGRRGPRELGGERRKNVAGTPMYMAPEQFLNEWTEFGPWTDLYAMGWIAYELASGGHPYAGLSLFEIAAAHRQTPPPLFAPRATTPPGFFEWVLRLLAKDPGERFQRAADAAWALEQLGDPREAGEALSASGMLPVAQLEPDASTVVLDAETASRLAIASRSATTSSGGAVVEPTGAEFAEAAQTDASGAGKSGPPLPVSWRAPSRPPRLTSMLGAGLSLYGLRTIPLVDRETERDLLWEKLRDVEVDGMARLVVVQGPSGTGKSRLVEWICERAHEVGAASCLRALHSPGLERADGLAPMIARQLRCISLPRAQVFARTRAVLERLGVREAYEWAALTEMIFPLVSDEVPEDDEWKNDETRRIVLFATPAERYAVLFRLLERLARERPLIVWLDDVQWGSDALDFAAYVMKAQALPPARILMLLTAQDEALAERPLETGQLEVLLHQERAERLMVGPLPVADHQALVETLLGLEGRLAGRVVRRTAGNPLFAVQLVGDWVQRGVLELGRSGFTLRAHEAARLPDDLHEVWRERVSRALEGLPAGAQQALEIASILGQNVDQIEWRLTCASQGIEVPDALLERLLSQRLIRLETDGARRRSTTVGLIFVHAMLRESLERVSREARRAEIHHRACATMLIRRHPTGAGAISERIARHLLAAGALEEAVEPLMSAATARREASEYALAHALLDQREAVLTRLGRPEHDRHWGEGWVLRAQLFIDQSRSDAANQIAEKAERSAERYGWVKVLPTAVEVRAFASRWKGDLVLADALAQKALSLFQALDDRRGAARCISRGLAQQALNRGDMIETGRLYHRGLRLHRELNDLHMQSYCLLNLGLVSVRRRNLKRAEVLINEAVALSERTGNLMVRADALRLLGQLALRREEPARAAALIEQARHLYHQKGAQLGEAVCLGDQGSVLRAMGLAQEAEDLCQRALLLFTALGSAYAFSMHISLGLLALEGGRYEVARAHIEPLIEELTGQGRFRYLVGCHAALAACAGARSDWAALDNHVGETRTFFEKVRLSEADESGNIELAGDLAGRAGERERAGRAWRLARSMWEFQDQQDRIAAIEAKLRGFA